MAKNLVIVESPTKAKTIAPFLGAGYEVKCSYGHIRDLPKKDLSVDIKKNFKPTYQIVPDKAKIVRELKKAAKNSDVWLASDEDREGEAIAWHLSEALGLDPKTTKRIVFHEITKPAILAAIEKPRTIDMKLVDAQQARRILDRLVGYELSPVLWKKVRAGLSAGRVQSVAVRLIVERERQIKNFDAANSFKITAVFNAENKELNAQLPKNLPDSTSAKKFLHDCIGANFTISAVENKPGTRSPSPPFTTSTLQQEAARRLGYSVRQTMILAQRLYESGHITYMRTDSTNLSQLAITAAEKYITSKFGAKYANSRQYKTRTSGAQEAHEAIRPTRMDKETAGADKNQKKLYNLIWRRALSSQMAAAKIQRTEIKITISSRQEQLVATGEVLVFDGFFKVYGSSKEDQILPAVQTGDKLKLETMTSLEVLSKPKARYSEASLVRKLEELGIGRPSTYAPTISTIQDRGYVEKKDIAGHPHNLQLMSLKDGEITQEQQETIIGADRNKLIPTHVAEVVTDFLLKYFAEIMDYDFTAGVEKEFDDIEAGKLTWQKMIEEFYQGLHPLIEKSGKASRAEAAQARQLGVDPKTKEPIIVRYGRYGPVLQLGDSPEAKDKDAKKPRFAPMPKGVDIGDITLEQALPMFDLPREVGKTPSGDIITASIGRFGPYLKVGSKFVSIKDSDPLLISDKEANRQIKEHQKKLAKKVIAEFGDIKILNGPYGPYVTNGKVNVRVPKEATPEKMTEKDAKKLLDNPSPPRNRRKYQR